MAQTTSKFRVIKDSSIYNNTKCSSYGDDVLMVDTSGGIYLGNETSTPDLIAASPNGTYPNMTVGFANDLIGRVEATPEVFTYHPSAGDKSIKDDSAFIRRVKGNSVVWNSMISSILRRDNFEGITTYYDLTTNECVIENISRSSNYSSGSNRLAIQPAVNFVSGHKYILVCNKNITGVGVYDQNEPLSFQDVNTVFSATNNSAIYFRIDRTFDFATQCPVGETLRLKIQLYDLTTMFGAGNEPTTVEEFRYLFPRKAYDYTEGILLNLSCYGIRTIGFNLIDKNNFADGVINNSETPVTAANYRHIKIAVFPNTEYYLKDVANFYYWNSYILYDNDMNRITASGKVVTGDIPYNVSFVLTTPINAAYMIVNVHKDFVDTCCINLHHTGYRDGDYEPYKEVTHLLPFSQITNGEPLRKAGSVYDEINETEYIKRVGTVDLGSLEWDYTSSNNFFTCYNLSDMKVTETNAERLDGLFCSKYPIDTDSTISTQATDKSIKRNAGVLYIRDTSFTSAAAFKAAVSGIILNYELAEPIVTTITAPIDFNYYIEDFGTEEALLTEDSAPFSADIVYQFNAVDTIRQNNQNIKKLMDDFIYWELY